MKYEIMRNNVNLKTTLSERKILKLRKTRKRKNAVKLQLGGSEVSSDFVELALKRSKFSDVTDNRKRKKKERMLLQENKNIQLSQLVNSAFEKENNSKTRLTAQRRSLISNMVS